jgi:hypothetical protein
MGINLLEALKKSLAQSAKHLENKYGGETASTG